MGKRAGTAISLAIAIGLSACGNSRPAEGDPPAAAAPAPAPATWDAAAPRNAGVLTMVPPDGGAWGGLAGTDPGPVPGLPKPPPRGGCEEAIAHVRQLLCREKVARGDHPLAAKIRDALVRACTRRPPSTIAPCIRSARVLSDVAACPRAASASPDDCETIRLQMLKLELLDETCLANSSRMTLDLEEFRIARFAAIARGADEWAQRCGKESIPAAAMKCVRAAVTDDELARCGL